MDGVLSSYLLECSSQYYHMITEILFPLPLEAEEEAVYCKPTGKVGGMGDSQRSTLCHEGHFVYSLGNEATQ